MTSNEVPFDPYKTLQVDPEAEDEVIEAAYRRLARKYHPDVAPGDEAQGRMVALNRAWEMLRDPAHRASVDRARSTAATRSAWDSAGPAAESAATAATAAATPTTARPPEPAGPPTTPAPRAARDHRYEAPEAGTSATPDDLVPDWRSTGASGAGTRAWPGGSADTGESAGYGAFSRNVRRGPDPSTPGYSPGRSYTGSGYDPGTMRSAEGTGAAGPPPGNPMGSMLRFGRYDGWSLGEIARVDLEYLEWLVRMPIGRPYQGEIDRLLRVAGRRNDPGVGGARRGPFRRR